MNGYTDGSFRPDNTVTLEEACAAVLKLLSYKTTDMTGSFPQAQLNKAQQIGLRDQLTCTQGQAMTYEQSTLLLYNALRANTASGSAYGSSLGFTVSMVRWIPLRCCSRAARAPLWPQRAHSCPLHR